MSEENPSIVRIGADYIQNCEDVEGYEFMKKLLVARN